MNNNEQDILFSNINLITNNFYRHFEYFCLLQIDISTIEVDI